MEHDFFIEVLAALSKKSKCVSRKVGALLVKEGRIISTGYNGTISGVKNCCDHFTDNYNKDEHHSWSLKNEIHAEQNAIAMAAKHGISINGCTCYSSLQPCNSCLLLLIQSGITKIYYTETYEKSDYHSSLIDAMKKLNIILEKI